MLTNDSSSQSNYKSLIAKFTLKILILNNLLLIVMQNGSKGITKS